MIDRYEDGFWPLPFPPLRQFLQYWAERRGDRRCPDKGDIDPVDIPELIPDLVLYDAPDIGGTFRYRLAGERATRLLGREVRGLTHRELHEGGTSPDVAREVARVEREYTWIAREFRGGFRTTRILVPDREHIRIARLTLPLGEVEGAARYLVSIMIEVPETVPFAVAHFGIDLGMMRPVRLPGDVEAPDGDVTAFALA